MFPFICKSPSRYLDLGRPARWGTANKHGGAALESRPLLPVCFLSRSSPLQAQADDNSPMWICLGCCHGFQQNSALKVGWIMEMHIDVFCMRMIVSAPRQTSVAGASLILLTAVCSEWLDKSIQRVPSGTGVRAGRAAGAGPSARCCLFR